MSGERVAASGSSPTGREYPPELVHGELCATRFGIKAKCDCGKESEPAPARPKLPSGWGRWRPADTLLRAAERAAEEYGAAWLDQPWHDHLADFIGEPRAAAFIQAADPSFVAALLAVGERDRQHIAQLTAFVSAYDNLDHALDNLLDYLKLVRWSEPEDRNVKAALAWAARVSGYYGRANAARAAVLADKEDAA